jgi:hypothetical protein
VGRELLRHSMSDETYGPPKPWWIGYRHVPSRAMEGLAYNIQTKEWGMMGDYGDLDPAEWPEECQWDEKWDQEIERLYRPRKRAKAQA